MLLDCARVTSGDRVKLFWASALTLRALSNPLESFRACLFAFHQAQEPGFANVAVFGEVGD